MARRGKKRSRTRFSRREYRRYAPQQYVSKRDYLITNGMLSLTNDYVIRSRRERYNQFNSLGRRQYTTIYNQNNVPPRNLVNVNKLREVKKESHYRRLREQHKLQQELERRMYVCEKRRKRREILHALKRTGKGRGNKPPRWTRDSYIKC